MLLNLPASITDPNFRKSYHRNALTQYILRVFELLFALLALTHAAHVLAHAAPTRPGVSLLPVVFTIIIASISVPIAFMGFLPLMNRFMLYATPFIDFCLFALWLTALCIYTQTRDSPQECYTMFGKTIRCWGGYPRHYHRTLMAFSVLNFLLWFLSAVLGSWLIRQTRKHNRSNSNNTFTLQDLASASNPDDYVVPPPANTNGNTQALNHTAPPPANNNANTQALNQAAPNPASTPGSTALRRIAP